MEEVKSFDDVELGNSDKLLADEEQTLETPSTPEKKAGKESEETKAEKESVKVEESKETEGTSEEVEDKAKEKTTETEEEEAEEKKVVIDGDEYTPEDLKELLLGNLRQQDYTKKTQEVAEQRKSIEPFLDFIEKIKDKSELVSDLKDLIGEEIDEDTANLIDKVIEADTGINPYKTELDDSITRLEEIESTLSLDNEKTQLMKDFSLKEDEADAVIAFAIKKFEEDGIALPLSAAHKQMDYDNMKKKVSQKAKPEVPKFSDKTTGAKKITTPEKIGSFEDIKAEGYNLFE